MPYYFSKKISGLSFEEAQARVTEELKKEGFGVLTEIDIKATFKKKLDADFRPYTIIGACNPHFAYKALQMEDKIGVFLPCNLVIESLEDGKIEVTAVDPIASMVSVENEVLGAMAGEIQDKLKRVIGNL